MGIYPKGPQGASPFGRMLALAIGVVVLLIFFISVRGLFETVDAGEIVVKQDLLGGGLHVWEDPGPHWQWWGKVAHYRRSSQFWFTKPDDISPQNAALKVRFNDGGHATLSGSVRYNLPMDIEHVLKMHMTFGSQDAVERSLIQTVMEKAVYFSGALMSSTQSFSEKKSELIGAIEDQAQHGIVRQNRICQEKMDELTKKVREFCTVEFAKDSKGAVIRVEKSPIEEYGINLSNLSFNDPDYDEDVKSQIKTQQKLAAEVQSSIAEFRKAEQRTLTAGKSGEEKAMTAKWEQEVIKAKKVTEATQDKEVAITQGEKEKRVAELKRDAAAFTKQEQILLGEGEAARRRAVMSADGALDKKLAAWVEVQKAYAAVMGQQKLVPDVQFGGSTAAGAGGAQAFMEMMTVKAARDLALDFRAGSGMGVAGASAPAAPKIAKK